MAVDVSFTQAASVVILGAVSLFACYPQLKALFGGNVTLPPLVKYKARWLEVHALYSSLSHPQWPILGSTFDFIKDPEGFTREACKKYGPVFRVYFRGHVQAVVGKDHVRDIFLNPAFSYEEAVKDEFRLADMLGTSKTKLEPHRLLAGVLTPYLARFIPVLSGVLTRGFDVGVGMELATPKQIEDPSGLISDVIARATTVCFFGEGLGTNPELIPLYKDFALSIGHFVNRKSPILALFPSIAKLYMWIKFTFSSPTASYRATVLKYTMPVVNERRAKMAELGDDYDAPLDSLQAYLNMIPPDQPIDEMELGTMMLTLVFFSIHTTTKRTTICLYNLAKYPQFLQELLDEQKAILGDNWMDGTVTLDHLKRLVKLDSFIRESFRTGGRSIALPHKIVGMDAWALPGGFVLPKGTVVNINTDDVYYSPELQGPNPEEFNAWRFVGTDKGAARIGPDMVAFGLGRHACPGRFFAVHEMKIALSLILKRYRISFPEGVKPSGSGPLVFTPMRAL
ncbi:cytochrome P450 [Laetiporus sulphureus 93-53]|uniref:Cytochrome P450 n=1 Tax=Laetiporus sulphureus 93-53 TaxID=1314785 RepID=A0A165B6C7_9APHY|nr:cytochrome P450 [Laetiporus sulphureus 93-53]KZT00342.1 cytochrome P450 [Laetiporus sulphureus 93-53]